VAAPAKIADMLCDRFVDVRLLPALGGEIARRLDPEVDKPVRFGLREGRSKMDGPLGLDAFPSLFEK